MTCKCVACGPCGGGASLQLSFVRSFVCLFVCLLFVCLFVCLCVSHTASSHLCHWMPQAVCRTCLSHVSATILTCLLPKSLAQRTCCWNGKNY